MKKKDFLTLQDLTVEDLSMLVDRAWEYKKSGDRLSKHCPLIGKSVGLLFEKPSTRTRVSFEVGIHQLGGHALFLNPQDIQLSRGETVHDTARVLSRYLAALIVRTYSQDTLETLAKEADIPVINALTDTAHPCQTLGDLLTIREQRGDTAGAKVTYLGDGNNVANSLIIGCTMLGLNLVLACPEGYDPDPRFLQAGIRMASENRGSVRIERNPVIAASGAEFLYTDVWTSMGQENEAEKRHRDLSAFQLNRSLLEVAAPDAKIMHCLPAHRGEEITDEMMEHPRSIVIDQAENRLYAQKAMLEWVIK